MTHLTVPNGERHADGLELSVEPSDHDGLDVYMEGRGMTREKIGHISGDMLHTAATHDELVVPERTVE